MSPAADGPFVGLKAKKLNDPGHSVGNRASGKQVFRFETFGNERFWTEAMRMPQGMMKEKVTILMALKEGLMIDIEMVDPITRANLERELKTDLSPRNAPTLHDPKATLKVLNANAFAGLVTVDSNRDGRRRVESGDKLGVACAICHTITDKSVFDLPGGGSVGRRIDGPANWNLNMGPLLATAANSLAYYPNLQLELGGKTAGRAPRGLSAVASEAEVDAYLKNPRFYPRGTFDDSSDGVGNPIANVAFFRTDLAAPWGSSALNNVLDHIANGSYTVNLDMTTLATPEGLKHLTMASPKAGPELWRNYVAILKRTGVRGYPYVKAKMIPTGVGKPATPTGRQVDKSKLFDLNAYTDSLPAPKGAVVDMASFARGREVFRQECTSCHNVDQSKPVPPIIVDVRKLDPGYRPSVLARRKAPLSPIQNSQGTFDDRAVVEDASGRGEKRGFSMPLLLDLARKPFFLHDVSVTSLESLLNQARGAKSPHPFYIRDEARRNDVVTFLKGLDTGTQNGRMK
ncbi:MAG: hypothetical protein H7Y17_05685 [Chlorobia bacterium]|nr:hypothetical protein [Fimbriimonadaceae bacterium]